MICAAGNFEGEIGVNSGSKAVSAIGNGAVIRNGINVPGLCRGFICVPGLDRGTVGIYLATFNIYGFTGTGGDKGIGTAARDDCPLLRAGIVFTVELESSAGRV